jgi:hypothetical protein
MDQAIAKWLGIKRFIAAKNVNARVQRAFLT